MNNNKALKKRIANTRKAIRAKYLALKSSRAEIEHAMEQKYTPIVKPLQEIASNLDANIKLKNEFIPKSEIGTNTAIKLLKQKSTETIPLKSQEVSTLTDYEREFDDVFEPDYSNTNQDVSKLIDSPSFSEYLEQYPKLVREYIKNSIKDTKGDIFDHNYGPRYVESNDKWLMGNSIIDFQKNDIIVINGKPFNGTIGLYELIFKIVPDNERVTDDDRVVYHTILDLTSAHKRNYNPTEQYSGNRYHKWKEVIRPMLMKVHSRYRGRYYTVGSTEPPPQPTKKKNTKGGSIKMMDVTNKPFDYRYWDDPNELVDRLRLLWAEQDAGHTGHNNEILAILEELREAGIIY